MSKFFPIKTETSCLAKWSYSKIVLEYGLTSSCHRVTHHRFDLKDFNFHNTPLKISQREEMLAGQWPDGNPEFNSTTCKRYCGALEATGAGSDRDFYNSIPDLYPPELDQDQTLTSVDPTILEVYMSNTCNLSCVYCIPELSSKIHTEMIKHGKFEKNGVVLESKHNPVDNYDQIKKGFWDWMNLNAGKLKRLHLLGGEPMYQKDFDTFFKFFDNNPCPNLELQITTNLMLNQKKFKHYIDQIKQQIDDKKLKRLDVVCSIDCWGKPQEYVRSGIDLTIWEENFKKLLNEHWIVLHTHAVVSALTIKTLPELLEKMAEWKKIRDFDTSYEQLFFPSYMSFENFDGSEFKQEFDQIISIVDDKHLKAIKLISEKSCSNKKELLKLITYLDEMDRRRGTNWTNVFPWLERYKDVV